MEDLLTIMGHLSADELFEKIRQETPWKNVDDTDIITVQSMIDFFTRNDDCNKMLVLVKEDLNQNPNPNPNSNSQLDKKEEGIPINSDTKVYPSNKWNKYEITYEH